MSLRHFEWEPNLDWVGCEKSEVSVSNRFLNRRCTPHFEMTFT